MKVLVVDDSRAMRNYVGGVLKNDFDVEVDAVDSGFEAFRLLARKQFDIIITDINMPDINGLELIRFVRKSDRHSATHIVVITSQTTPKLKERILDLGVDGFLFKPFEPGTLVELIRGIAGDTSANEAGDG